MKKHLVIKYFDTYSKRKFYFNTAKAAYAFMEEKIRNNDRYLISYEYRGEIQINDWNN